MIDFMQKEVENEQRIVKEYEMLDDWAKANMMQLVLSDPLKGVKKYFGTTSIDKQVLASNDLHLKLGAELLLVRCSGPSLHKQITFKILNCWTDEKLSICSFVVSSTENDSFEQIIQRLNEAKQKGMEKMFSLGLMLTKFSGEKCFTGSIV